MVIAFAATSLDTGARIQRLIIAELAESYGVRPLTNRYVAGSLGIAAALLLAVTQAGGKGGLILWPLFGTTNQLVASVTLLIVSVWLQTTRSTDPLHPRADALRRGGDCHRDVRRTPGLFRKLRPAVAARGNRQPDSRARLLGRRTRDCDCSPEASNSAPLPC